MKNILVFCLILCSTTTYAQGKISLEKLEMDNIKKSIKMFIQSGTDKRFGIQKQSDIDSLIIGNSIPIYSLDLRDSTLHNTSTLLYPIILKDNILFFAKGVQEGDSTKIQGIGSDIFAQKFNSKRFHFDPNQKVALLNIPELNYSFAFYENNLAVNESLDLKYVAIEYNCQGCISNFKKEITLNDIINKIWEYNFKNKENEDFTN